MQHFKVKSIKKKGFDRLFLDQTYISLKNYLYNYQLRKKAINSAVGNSRTTGFILEVGSGISPITMPSRQTVFADISFEAIRILKRTHKIGHWIVADINRLPFKQNIFDKIICSEVLEHLPDDQTALLELNRLCELGGKIFITFPHRKDYFGIDDEIVQHCRRYDIQEIIEKIKIAGFKPLNVVKILGPMEKKVMILFVRLYMLKVEGARQSMMIMSNKCLRQMMICLFRAINFMLIYLMQIDAIASSQKKASTLLLNCKKCYPVSIRK